METFSKLHYIAAPERIVVTLKFDPNITSLSIVTLNSIPVKYTSSAAGLLDDSDRLCTLTLNALNVAVATDPHNQAIFLHH